MTTTPPDSIQAASDTTERPSAARGWWLWLRDHALVAGTIAGIIVLLLAGWLIHRR